VGPRTPVIVLANQKKVERGTGKEVPNTEGRLVKGPTLVVKGVLHGGKKKEFLVPGHQRTGKKSRSDQGRKYKGKGCITKCQGVGARAAHPPKATSQKGSANLLLDHGKFSTRGVRVWKGW